MRTLALAALATLAAVSQAPAQSDILLRLRSGSPPGDRFRVDSAGGVVAVTNLGIGIIPATGAGYRMMYYPFKAAFRLGHANGTEWDDANIGFYSWAGGESSMATAFGTFAFGDQTKVTGVDGAAFGGSNEVGGTAGFSAGASNNACGFGSVAIGFTNTTGSIDASGNCLAGNGQGAVAIGYRVTADADYAVALGHRASANGHDGVFVAGDESTTDSIEAVANNEFAARYAGGFRFRTNATLTTGCNLPAGSGVFSCSSSRTLKDHFGSVDGEELLARLRGVPVSTWSYISEGAQVRHMGPFAEDFRAAFGLGTDDKAIGLLDIDGVNFAAVKALENRTAELQRQVAERDRRISDLEARLARIEAALAAKPSN
ncbi:tail fiber domain-containing protein [Longimicrobium sp.]|uniref:tail fiber domain-containing protein n=1 Tax=Longimicrobium sp. TaxID=2029185 RepID=UPI002B6EF321|nr:tail fiber domain-containing protein [Longimicrobium sp.]HSU12782.1 tail fiber domain-containing protein [Longimicrobium sp.]